MAPSAVSRPFPSSAASTGSSRLWEVDAARGAAVILMIFFHLMWDLWYFGLTAIDITAQPWQIFARSIGSTFLFVMGVSLVLSEGRLRRSGRSVGRWLLYRGLMILGFAMLISGVTLFAVGDAFVRFGILHLAGVTILLAYPFLKLRWPVAALTGAGVLLVGLLTGQMTLLQPSPWLLPLGVAPTDLEMVDYYPLIPWSGMVLAGIAVGKRLYRDGERQFGLPDLSQRRFVRGLNFLGRHSLAAYLIHQPVLVGTLLLFQSLSG